MTHNSASETQLLSRMVDEALALERHQDIGIQISTLASLGDHLFALYDIFVAKGLIDTAPDSAVQATVHSIVRHEGDHAQAALQIGACSVDFGLHVRPPDTEGTNPHFWATTASRWQRKTIPLELAAISLHPLIPSDGDFKDMRALGYESIGAVIDSILTYNETTSGIALPIPRSHTLGIAHAF